MDKDTVKRIESLEQRVGALEKASTKTEKPDRNIVELDLTLPEADIDGLHFNRQEVRAVFEKQDDGWYHSRDSLFLSARNTVDDNSRDILTEYLCDSGIRTQIADRLGIQPADIIVSLPEKNQGVKKYNGVDCWYWLRPPYAGSAAYFAYVASYGYANNTNASAVGGCAPAFRVAERHG
ncbi:MAG: hypothetical protein LBG43_00335 [Treponema sp.]|jgi:hypothetical protein|nr:hypothetical protein [Treponema sp.]